MRSRIRILLNTGIAVSFLVFGMSFSQSLGKALSDQTKSTVLVESGKNQQILELMLRNQQLQLDNSLEALNQKKTEIDAQTNWLNINVQFLGVLIALLAFGQVVIGFLTVNKYTQEGKNAVSVAQNAANLATSVSSAVNANVQDIKKLVDEGEKLVENMKSLRHKAQLEVDLIAQKTHPDEKLTPPQLAEVENFAISSNSYERLNGLAIQAEQSGDWDNAKSFWGAVLAMNPENSRAYFGAAFSLNGKADKTIDIEERLLLLNSAASNYEMAASLDPQDSDTWYNWGSVLLEIGNLLDLNDSKLQSFELAQKKFLKSIDLKPSHYDSWFNLATSFRLRADCNAIKDHKSGLIQRAIECFKKASGLKDDDPDVWKCHGESLEILAELTSSVPDKRRLLEEANGLLTKAVNNNNLSVDYLVSSSNILIDLGMLPQEKETRDEYLRSAEEKLRSAETIAPGSGSYNLASIYSIDNKIPDAKEQLERAREYGKLETRNHMETDPDFNNLRTSDPDWFSTFLDRAF